MRQAVNLHRKTHPQERVRPSVEEVFGELTESVAGVEHALEVFTQRRLDHRYVSQLLVDNLHNLPRLDGLTLHADHMDDETFELLNSGKLSRLETLRFAGREFDDTALSRVHPLPNLVVLDLEFTSVTDESVEHIPVSPD